MFVSGPQASAHRPPRSHAFDHGILRFNTGPPMTPPFYNQNMQLFQSPPTTFSCPMVHAPRIIPAPTSSPGPAPPPSAGTPTRRRGRDPALQRRAPLPRLDQRPSHPRSVHPDRRGHAPLRVYDPRPRHLVGAVGAAGPAPARPPPPQAAGCSLRSAPTHVFRFFVVTRPIPLQPQPAECPIYPANTLGYPLDKPARLLLYYVAVHRIFFIGEVLYSPNHPRCPVGLYRPLQTNAPSHHSMPRSYFSDTTLDDLLRRVVMETRAHGAAITPTKGPATELSGVLLNLRNPRARLSRTETRGKPYSCLGELCWYLSASDELSFIQYYLPAYKKYADAGRIHGAYGPRLFRPKTSNQFTTIRDILRHNPDSRRAVVQLFDAQDLLHPHNDVPCTCTLQFLLRGGYLHLYTTMRSNDVYLGLPHDIFCFTMIQEILARTLSVRLGTYRHFVGSLHLYDKNRREADDFLSEGWQSTIPMPKMPPTDPWPAIRLLLRAESALRIRNILSSSNMPDIPSYWTDLIRLLQIFRAKKQRNPNLITSLKAQMSSPIYNPFIDATQSRLRHYEFS